LDGRDPKEVFNKDGLFDELKKALAVWERVIPFFAFPEAVRRIIYTTNAIEALNAKLRRAVRTRGHFPTDDAAMKLLFLVLRNTAREWKMPPREWFEAKTQFAIMFDERFVQA
jgi:putative transposase